jgi:hypothetical protein
MAGKKMDGWWKQKRVLGRKEKGLDEERKIG